MKRIFTLLFLFNSCLLSAQKLETLTVEKIMRDPKWIGTPPSAIRWSDDSKRVFFKWNPKNAERDELFSITPTNTKPAKVSTSDQGAIIPQNGDWNKKHTLKVFEKNGDLWLSDLKNGKVQQLTSTTDFESDPSFSGDESRIIFHKGDNLYALKLNSSELVQLTNFVKSASAQGKRGAKKNAEQIAGNEQERWLKAEQLELFDIVKLNDKDRKLDSAERLKFAARNLRELVTDDRSVENVQINPDGRYITYNLKKSAEGVKNAIVPNYVTASGFTEDIPNRVKVGAPQDSYESFVFDAKRDTVYNINTKNIPGIKDIPAYMKDYPKELEQMTKVNAYRKVEIRGPYWCENGKQAVVAVDAGDFKDRWIMKFDPATGGLSLLDREHNDAWVGGPGSYQIGWTDDTHIFYQSEASGYSHIYIADVFKGTKRQVTSGNWEVQTLQLSADKKTFYFTANKDHPGVSDFYKIAASGGEPVKITSWKGGNDVTLSPDEQWLAIRHSYSNKPWEFYLQANKAGAKPVKITNSTTAEFNSYPWRDPQVITFKNRFGSEVYARLYLPKIVDPAKSAVVFVHGAGYLQNADYKWSYYFREYMFNNMLADNGYTVLDMDYSGSAGYGRDWRTAIYRHMGGKDLTDQVDGVKMLVEKYGVNPKHVGLYGGSYGGFITLMAMFNEPDTFAAGAAIRSVTDWAHYNHEYTAEILNEPFTDEKAYRQSSPIYFANGLKGNLLMLHGMIDQNVNYQDIIRLTQRLIELHKEDWQLASYPVEDHAFEQPSSWTDEYKRIFKLFETALRNRT